jgi:hypothetical protein
VAQQRRNAGFTGPLLNPSTVKEHKSRLLPWGESPNWWQTGIIYQIYPRSFQNGVHGGVGGLCERRDWRIHRRIVQNIVLAATFPR